MSQDRLIDMSDMRPELRRLRNNMQAILEEERGEYEKDEVHIKDYMVSEDDFDEDFGDKDPDVKDYLIERYLKFDDRGWFKPMDLAEDLFGEDIDGNSRNYQHMVHCLKRLRSERKVKKNEPDSKWRYWE